MEEITSLKGTLKRAEARKFSTVENFLRMRYKARESIKVKVPLILLMRHFIGCQPDC